MGFARHGWVLLLIAGCSGKDETDTVDTDTGTTAAPGQTVRVGTATVDSTSYAGVENLRFIADDGEGAVLCDISYTLTSTSVRDDCDQCLWAFDLQISEATVVVDEDGTCLTAVGIDASNVETLNGKVTQVGYTDNHLMSRVAGDWVAGDEASWDPASGALSYERADGLSTATSPPTDTGEAASGQKVRPGTATVDYASYLGTENLRFIADDGEGAVLCDISYTLTSATVRDDCGQCLWAFDLQVSDATVVVDEGGICLTAVGVDASTVETLNGTITQVGYTDNYFGHAEVVMTLVAGEWVAGDYASWDPVSGALTYEWDDGIYPY